jgi:hypothetical protein
MAKVLTSVKIEPEVYDQFKQNTSNIKFHLQDLVNRSMHLFLTDTNFRDTVLNYHIPVLSTESQKTKLSSVTQSETV